MDVFEELDRAFHRYKEAEEGALAVSRLLMLHERLATAYQLHLDRFSYAYRVTSEWYCGEQMPLEMFALFLLAVDWVTLIEVE
jgi:hypothetical protein